MCASRDRLDRPWAKLDPPARQIIPGKSEPNQRRREHGQGVRIDSDRARVPVESPAVESVVLVDRAGMIEPESKLLGASKRDELRRRRALHVGAVPELAGQAKPPAVRARVGRERAAVVATGRDADRGREPNAAWTGGID